MSDKKYIVPEGLKQAIDECGLDKTRGRMWRFTSKELEAIGQTVVRWLAENPTVPTEAQIQAMYNHLDSNPQLRTASATNSSYSAAMVAEWQRRMFLVSEPEVPDVVKDLIWSEKLYAGDNGFVEDIRQINNRILEAYRRGKESR